MIKLATIAVITAVFVAPSAMAQDSCSRILDDGLRETETHVIHLDRSAAWYRSFCAASSSSHAQAIGVSFRGISLNGDQTRAAFNRYCSVDSGSAASTEDNYLLLQSLNVGLAEVYARCVENADNMTASGISFYVGDLGFTGQTVFSFRTRGTSQDQEIVVITTNMNCEFEGRRIRRNRAITLTPNERHVVVCQRTRQGGANFPEASVEFVPATLPWSPSDDSQIRIAYPALPAEDAPRTVNGYRVNTYTRATANDDWSETTLAAFLPAGDCQAATEFSPWSSEWLRSSDGTARYIATCHAYGAADTCLVRPMIQDRDINWANPRLAPNRGSWDDTISIAPLATTDLEFACRIEPVYGD